MLCALCIVCIGVDSGQAAGATVGLNTSNHLSTRHDLDRSEDGDDSTTVPFHDPGQRNHVSDGFVHGLEVMVSTMLRGTGTRPKKMQHAVCDECRFDKGLVTRTLQSLSIFPHSGLEDRITDGQCLTHRRR